MRSASPHPEARDVARKTRPHAARVGSTRAAGETRPAAARTLNRAGAVPADRRVATRPAAMPQVSAVPKERSVAITEMRAAELDDTYVDERQLRQIPSRSCALDGLIGALVIRICDPRLQSIQPLFRGFSGDHTPYWSLTNLERPVGLRERC